MLAIGTKVETKGVRGVLTRVYGIKRGKVQFILQPHNPHCVYIVLQVLQQYTSIPWHWQARVALLQLVGE
jgi:hypothetical protein